VADPQARFEKLLHKLREAECRLTPQRVALLRLLAANDGHPSASQLYDQIKVQFPKISSPATTVRRVPFRHKAGKDLTDDLDQAPHGADLLDRFPVVGTLKEE